MQPTERFTDRVADYVRYRPGYPPQVVDVLVTDGGLARDAVIADIGSGTGKLSEPFLKSGFRVIGVEPNEAMRVAGDELLSHFAEFSSVAGSAESTTLPSASIDAVVAGQAFHWFDRAAAAAEFRRILRPPGLVALVWNDRLNDASDFLRGYEDLLVRLCPDYVAVGQTHFVESDLAAFFAPSEMRTAQFPNQQVFDFDGLVGRVLSSSYVPKAGPTHEEVLRDLRELFDRTAVDGRVVFECATHVFHAHIL